MAETDTPETPEQAREKAQAADHARLVELKRSAEAARAEVLAGPYAEGAWDPWRKLAEEYQLALSAHVKEYGGNRYEVEKGIWSALHTAEAA
ncbi:hypothetical protein GCM10010331_48810 [Streptomyces xanthochromogenes]|uniref:hypothetical protein n=1 Tax=Streptomyces xanthochromogenes TaxID=67384 RepID=UPI00167196C9|nr:hypothetical protein [Streptomyces xanthochromogenes]GHB55235.1 hypothetical protein GCM10010331_48810 [Streptomyces xanthochromogenes]